MKIAFFSPHMNICGTEVALYDYAHFNEILLGNKSIIIYEKNERRNHKPVVDKFHSRFDVFGIESYSPNSEHSNRGEFITKKINEVLEQNECDAVYIITGETSYNGVRPTQCKLLMHHVGPYPPSKMYGDASAYCSRWLSETYSGGKVPVVPHMINLPNVDGDLREELGIPKNALVFGRNGGSDSFDIEWAKQVVTHVVNQREDVYFLFQNTDVFYNHPKIIHLPMNAELDYKVKFINTCDALLHARIAGESFGLSCGEFSSKNKRIITWTGSEMRNHYYILGDRGVYYNTPQELYNILMTFEKQKTDEDFNCYRDYVPEKVMESFHKVFLQG